ncbi:phosphotransferase [Actinomycetospora soli]|uniref:phosphotransferase n=1 Tax=Actinomycetospora soli TaxID=2893887 RepID=UPI001E343192|nr:phosphotransferase [Actinomycetospora soli]MCD2190629.1 aminoglycoside phosphotransferase family protein [Actinomycetospora soli]
MTPSLPGGIPPSGLADGLGRLLGRRVVDVAVQAVGCIAHVATAPTTAGLHRVSVLARTADGERVPVGVVAKVLRPARFGLPPQMPDDARDHLDRVIPWRLEAEVVTTVPPDRFPPGLRLPAPVALTERDEEIVLWQEEVEVADRPWTAEDVVRAAGLLGRLAARRARDVVPWTGPSFVRSFLDDAVRSWAAPLLLAPGAWEHPEFAAAVERGLEEPVRALLDDLATDDAPGVAPWATVPVLPAHGDPTPDNLLRPAADPGSFVAIDWASATSAPVGWDVVPLVLGRAEAGRASAAEAVAVLPRALDAYADGLAAEGYEIDRAVLTAAVRALTRMRYGVTVLPLDALIGGRTRTSARSAQADLVAAVLAL